MSHTRWPLLLCALSLIVVAACVANTTGAPCLTSDNCPTGQSCIALKCELGAGVGGGTGSVGGGTGSVGGGTGGVGGGTGGVGGGSGGGAPGTETLCLNGLDDDNDGKFDCEDPDCEGKECRGAASTCDVAESCSNLLCPTDTFAASTVQCRAAATGAQCDVAEFCTGTAATCPVDDFVKAGVICRAANLSQPCDVQEVCSGIAAACPVDGFKPKGVSCRASAGVCDVEEVCPGDAAACPVDAFDITGTVCRVSAGLCDAAEKCSGSSASCPADLLLPSTAVCRPISGACDVEEKCTGVSTQCPTDINGCGATRFCQNGVCVPLFVNGKTCTDPAQCASNFCIDGVCCNTACGSACQSCNGATLGTCTNFAATSDPQSECAAFTCNGNGACFTACSGGSCSLDCKSGAYCTAGNSCLRDEGDGRPCSQACECASNTCTTFFRDSDGDGFGAATAPAKFCGTAAPTGYSGNSADCCDTDSRANPAGGPSGVPRQGCGGFDFNCDGTETKSFTDALACRLTGSCTTGDADCSGTLGWTAAFAPACGVTATYVTNCGVAATCNPSLCPGCLRCIAATTSLTETCK